MAQVEVTEKKYYVLLACGKSDWYTQAESLDVKQVMKDVDELGQKALMEKYFPGYEKETMRPSNPKVWVNGYKVTMKFSDGTDYYCESTDDGRNGLYRDNPNFEKIFGYKEFDEIFPEIAEEIERIY